LSRDYQEILRVEAAMRRMAKSGGVSGMVQRTIVRRADLIEGTADSLAAELIGVVARVGMKLKAER
jgi:hypothetical protein